MPNTLSRFGEPVKRKPPMPVRAWVRSEEKKLLHPAMAKDNVAVITGGASGIGLAAAVRFAEFGMKMCIADIGTMR